MCNVLAAHGMGEGKGGRLKKGESVKKREEPNKKEEDVENDAIKMHEV